MGRGGTVTLLQQALRPGTGTEYEAARREERLGMQEAEVRQTNGRCVVASALGLAEIVHNLWQILQPSHAWLKAGRCIDIYTGTVLLASMLPRAMLQRIACSLRTIAAILSVRRQGHD